MTIYAFDDFELDSGCFELRQNGSAVPLEPQVFRLLLLLVERRDRLVTKDDVLDEIWKGRFVSEAALSSRIKSARQALGDDGAAQRYIRTVRGEGFRFVAEVAEGGTEAASGQPAIARDVAAVMRRPSIGVFPFTGGGDHPEAEWLLDGLGETLVAELAAWRWLPVISRNATAGVDPDAPLIERARALGLRYAVTGKLATFGERARLTVELLDVDSGQSLLSERFEDSVGGLIGLQADIAATLLRLAAPEIDGAERRRIVRQPQENLSAWDLTMQALWALNSPTAEGLRDALGRLENSIRLDPGAALPWSLKAQAHYEIGLNGWLGGEMAMARDCFVAMLQSARQAVELDPRGWLGHSLTSAGELWAASAYAPARHHADEALRLNPSAGMAHHLSGCIVGFGGDPAAAFEIQRHVYAVDPGYRHATVVEADLGLWQFLLGDMEAAQHHLDLSLSHHAGNQRARQRRIAVRARLGDIAGAQADAAELKAQGAVLTRDYVRGSYPFQQASHGQALLEALLASGAID